DQRLRSFAVGFSETIHCKLLNSTASPQLFSTVIFTLAILCLTILAQALCTRSTDAQPRRFQTDAQAAGGHRPHCGRLRQAKKSWGSELFRALSVSQREDTIILGTRHTAILPLLWLRRIRRRVQLCPEDREHYISRGRKSGCPETGHSAAQAPLQQSCGSQGSPITHPAARNPRACLCVFSGISQATGRSACTPISSRARAGRGNDQDLSNWLCTRFRISPPGSSER